MLKSFQPSPSPLLLIGFLNSKRNKMFFTGNEADKRSGLAQGGEMNKQPNEQGIHYNSASLSCVAGLMQL